MGEKKPGPLLMPLDIEPNAMTAEVPLPEYGFELTREIPKNTNAFQRASKLFFDPFDKTLDLEPWTEENFLYIHESAILKAMYENKIVGVNCVLVPSTAKELVSLVYPYLHQPKKVLYVVDNPQGFFSSNFNTNSCSQNIFGETQTLL
eukprot:gb/GECH01001059.1/.p1 GENE.gb/GECH01001059.1/~~gb/GECH01001059.1/.p1  ORF type:complete len:148 (+),score=20.97 gb/GECH01001059.1/:1-444(+)